MVKCDFHPLVLAGSIIFGLLNVESKMQPIMAVATRQLAVTLTIIAARTGIVSPRMSGGEERFRQDAFCSWSSYAILLYSAVGCGGSYSGRICLGPHKLDVEMQEDASDWFERWLSQARQSADLPRSRQMRPSATLVIVSTIVFSPSRPAVLL